MKLLTTDHVDARVRAALAALTHGRPVVVVDDSHRSNEGDLILAASLATTETIAFMIRHTSGFVCVALPGDDCDRLQLPAMHSSNNDPDGTAYCVATDLKDNGTGISAMARARTIGALADPTTTATDLARPGHVIPLRARPGGVLERHGHTEAGVDLMQLAGLAPAAALAEITSTERPEHMASRSELKHFATQHDLVLLSVEDIADYRLRTETTVTRQTLIPTTTRYGPFDRVDYRDIDGNHHTALVAGTIGTITPTTPIHIHRDCQTAEIFGNALCECTTELSHTLARFGEDVSGIVIHLRGGDSTCAQTTTLSTRQQAIEAHILADLTTQVTPQPCRDLTRLARTA
ncbi:3,4-dihydroxy-2-butanone-4-phosphate synthase [Gordonia sp. CPCC 205515]|uniref:3,4-dihydroxy-2-butanone-4-phosphate synthase n=1 Tax=Gordonia sp. CPCC 205515 TaxID=3140791 RepID=UPI003AF3B30B